MNKDRDLELVERCRNGDTAAFEVLVFRYQRPVYNAAYRMLGDSEAARDISQIVFLKVFERLDKYDSRYKFFSWIYRIAVNEALNTLRRSGREEPLSGREQAPASIDPARLADKSETSRRLQNTLKQLNVEDRVVLTLRHFLDCSYRDIGDILEIPEKTVKSRLYSARQRLRERLSTNGG